MRAENIKSQNVRALKKKLNDEDVGTELTNCPCWSQHPGGEGPVMDVASLQQPLVGCEPSRSVLLGRFGGSVIG